MCCLSWLHSLALLGPGRSEEESTCCVCKKGSVSIKKSCLSSASLFAQVQAKLKFGNERMCCNSIQH